MWQDSQKNTRFWGWERNKRRRRWIWSFWSWTMTKLGKHAVRWGEVEEGSVPADGQLKPTLSPPPPPVEGRWYSDLPFGSQNSEDQSESPSQRLLSAAVLLWNPKIYTHTLLYFPCSVRLNVVYFGAIIYPHTEIFLEMSAVELSAFYLI